MCATSWMRRSKTPIVDGFVSMMPAVCGPTTACSASRSMSPFGSVGISLTVHPHMVAVAGFVPCAAIRADHRDTGEFALRARHRRQRHAAHAGDLLEHLLQLEQDLQQALAR